VTLVWTVARRLILREGVAGGGGAAVLWMLLVATIVAIGSALVFAGVRSVAPPLAGASRRWSCSGRRACAR
jgi:hypothetical protein